MPEEPTPAAGTTPGGESPGSILVVDDDRVTLHAIESILKGAGYTVLCAESERAAMTAFRKQRPSVVLTDIYMIGKSGLDLLHQIRSLHASVPVIVLTGRSDLDTVTQALRDGAFDYLQKPVQREVLCDIVSRAMQAASPRATARYTVLVVEDDPVEAGITRAILEEADYAVLSADGAEQAERYSETADLDAVVTDMILRGRSGLDILVHFRNRRPEVPVIVTTARPELDIAIRCLRAGAFDFLPKPLEEKVLLDSVTRAHERKTIIDAGRRLDAVRRQYEARLREIEGQTAVPGAAAPPGATAPEADGGMGAYGFLVTNSGGTVIAVSPSAPPMLGVTLANLLGKRAADVASLVSLQVGRTALEVLVTAGEGGHDSPQREHVVLLALRART